MKRGGHIIRLEDAYKGYTLDQDKVVTPEDTVRNFRERLARTGLGILEETVRIDRGRLGIPVYFSMCGEEARSVIGTRKQMGKGGTPAQAEASAVMELAERYSFFSFYKTGENFMRKEYTGLSGPRISLDLIAASVDDESPDLDRALEFFAALPQRWCWAWNLSTNSEVIIPIDWFYALNEFNGTCAGNCNEEAILQGICEVVERHVSAIVARENRAVPGIDLNSIADGIARELIEKYKRAGIRLFSSDFSLGLGIPTISVLAYDPSTYPERSEIVWTAGTASSPHKALIRALTETAQLAGDFDTISRYVASGLPKPGHLDEVAHMVTPQERLDISTLPDISHENIKVEVERAIQALQRSGLQVIVVNTTHPVLEIPAFYIIVPGARFRERSSSASVGMFTARLISQAEDKSWAISRLMEMDQGLPGKYYIKFYLGVCYLELMEPAKALEYFEEALRLNPHPEDLPFVYSYKAVSLKELGEYDEALKVLETAVELDPERTDLHNLMGFCHFRMGRYQEAIRCFERVVQIDPTSAVDYANLGVNYHRLGEGEKAKDFYMVALEMDPSIGFARKALEELLAES